MKRRLAVLLFLPAVLFAQDSKPVGIQFDHGGIVRGDVTRKRLSLVFTGGEFAEGVPAILAACKARGVPASFFITGDFLRLHPDAAKSIVAAGHLLGPHGDRHLLYCSFEERGKSLVTQREFAADLQQNLDDLKTLGAPPTRYFIPPYEWYNQEQVRWAGEIGLTLINFTPGSGSNRDYIPEGEAKFTPSAKLVEGILNFESTAEHGLNGFLMLLHAGSRRQDKMHDHLDPLLAELQRRGYAFVTLDELLGE